MILLIGFSITDIYGKSYNLEDFNSYIILDFWATWCAHCDEELDKLNKEFYNDSLFKIVAISLDTKREVEKIKQIAKSRNWKFIITIDEGKKIASKYGVVGLPTVVILDKNLKVKKKITGYHPNLLELIRKSVK